jgi:putative PIN family toxin of toxin-antitoxin system
MIPVVLDTNILVSALWTKSGNAARIVQLFAEEKIRLFYDAGIMAEYTHVLKRPKFAFESVQVDELLKSIRNDGMVVAVTPSALAFVDESDRKFYDVARACGAFLITGNLKHYPQSLGSARKNEPFIITAAAFLARLQSVGEKHV